MARSTRKKTGRRPDWRKIVFAVLALLIVITMALAYVLPNLPVSN